MADTEFRALPREPSFVRPLETASHRRSRASHDSAAASTRSWVLMNQQSPPPPAEPIPVPEPVPALAARPLPQPPQRVELGGAEHMSVELPSASAADLGYHWTGAGPGTKKEGKGFVGGFVSGLRRLPRALVRNRRPRRGTTLTEGTEGTDGTGMTGNTLPRYVSTPPTPVVADARVGFVRPGPRAVRENEEEGRRRKHPSFLVMPPEEDGQQGIPTPLVYDDPEGHGDGEAMPGALDLPQAPLENPYDRDTTSHRAVPPRAVSPHPSRADDGLTVPVGGDGDEPVSVHAHPLPTDDYRRMSAQDVAHPSRTTITSPSFSADSPSFSSELNGFHRFFNTLHLLPWVATDRITVDYRPKSKSTTGVSWYHPAGAAPSPADTHHHALDASPSPASAGSSPRTPQRHRTHHRRAAIVPSPPTPPMPYGYPFAYYPAFSPPAPQGTSRRPVHTHTHGPRGHRHHRRSATYHGSASWVPPPLPAPVYVIQASPAAAPPPDLSPEQTQTHNGSPAKPVGQLLAPVYMQIRGGGGAPGAFWHGHGAAESAFAYSSPIAMPAPAQTGE